MSTKRIRKRCCIGGCLNTDINTVSLHRVPEDTRSPGIKEKWCSIIRKSKGKPAWEPLKNSVVCGHHFTWKDFHGKRDQGFVKTSLRKEAVPSRKLGPLITPTPSPPPEEEELASAMDMDSTDFSAPSTSQRASQFDNRGPGGIMSPDDINKNLFKLQRQLNQVIENKKFNELVDPDEPYFSEFDEESFPDFDLGCEEEIGEVDSDDEFEGEIFDEEKLYMDESELQPSLMLEVEVDDERRIEADAVKYLSPSPPPAPKPRYPCPSCPKTFLRPDHLELHQILHAADKDRNNANAGPLKKPKLDTSEDPPAPAVVSETSETALVQGTSSTDMNGQKPAKPREWPKRFLSLPPSNNILSTSSILAKVNPISIMPAPTKPKPILPAPAPVTPIVATPAIKPKPKLPPPLIPISSVPRFQPRTEVVQIKEQKNEDNEEPGRKYQCRFCPKRFSRTDHLQQHLTIHTGCRPYKCHVCPKAFPILVTLKRHLKTHMGAKEFPCTKCPRKFTQIGHLKRHMDSPFTHTTVASGSANQEHENTEDQEDDDEQEEETVEEEQQCKFCGEIVLGLRALLHHYQQNHYQKSVQEQLVGIGEDEEQDVDPDPNFVCRLCDESFVSREERFSHEILVHKIKNANARLECKYCKKVICTFNGLAKHIRRHEEGRGGNNGNGVVDTEPEQVHEQEAEEQEDSDGAGAEAGDVVTPASDVTLWTCRLCPQVFLEQLERLVHENSVHNTKDSTQIHVCKHCSKEIATFRGLTKHLRNIHGERTIPEDQRPRLPTTKKKPIPQPVHTQTQALMEYEQEEDGEDSGTAPSEVYICRLCDLMFTSLKDRLSHENDDHGTREPGASIQCKFCYQITNKFKHYLEHLRRRHPDETFVRLLTEEETMDTTPRHFLDF